MPNRPRQNSGHAKNAPRFVITLLAALLLWFGYSLMRNRHGDTLGLVIDATIDSFSPDDNALRFVPIDERGRPIDLNVKLPPTPVMHPPIPPNAVPRPLTRFALASETWGATLNPTGSVPDTGYAAYYIDAQNPRQAVAQEHVENISISYGWSEFHQIPSARFGAYWVGRLRVPQKGLYRVMRHISHGKMRVMLDGHVLTEGSGEDTPPLELDAGDYLLEVEYLNNWHTVSFQLALAPAIDSLDNSQLRAAVATRHLPAQTVVYAVGVHDSPRVDGRIRLQAPAGDAPYILMLGSPKGVHWEIEGRAPALVISNNAELGSVRANGNVATIAWNGRVPYQTFTPQKPQCHCAAGMLNCETPHETLGDFVWQVQQITGFALAGVSGGYEPQALAIPETVINEAILRADERMYIEREELFAKCTDQHLADFENVMKKR